MGVNVCRDHNQEELEGYGEALFNESISVVTISHNVKGDVKLERRWNLANFTLLIQEFRDLPCVIAEGCQQRPYTGPALQAYLANSRTIV
jgi:hypothetical protein